MSGAFIYMFNHLAIENTNAAYGWHRRIVVYNKEGKRLYGISFGMRNIHSNKFQFRFSGYTPEFGKEGEGIVYVDYQNEATQIIVYTENNRIGRFENHILYARTGRKNSSISSIF
ncbi:hypothetical protein [Hydrogenimonas sp.]